MATTIALRYAYGWGRSSGLQSNVSSVDLSATFDNKQVVRDFLFVRDLETLVVFDRGSSVFLAHCEQTPTTNGAAS